MKIIFWGLIFVSSLAFAETATVTIEGMHCAGCKSMITKSVCEDAKLQKTYETCSVELIDAKKQIGKVTLVAKKGEKINLAAVKDGIKAAGDDYKVTKEEVK